MTRLTIQESMQNESVLTNTTFRILPNGDRFYMVNDAPVSVEEMVKKYPVQNNFTKSKRGDIDTRRAYLQ